MKKKKTKSTNNQELNKKYLAKVKQLNNDAHINAIYQDLLHGKNAYLRMRRLESSVFDSSWIEVVEDVLFDLGEIVGNPRQVTKQESSIVPIELAKKTDGESVQHLASHTQYIKEIDAHGNVVPSKILSHSNEDNLFTYENRFIATFIRRLVLFIEKRYEFIHNIIPLHVEDVLYVKNSSIVNEEQVEIETKIKITRDAHDDLADRAKGFIERIEKMREYIFYYYNSPFMRKMKNEKDVRKPILQTNIIRKNLKYRHCFEVFTFIEKFDALGVNYKVTEDYLVLNEKEMLDVNFLLLGDYLSVKNEMNFEEVKRSQKEYKPKILTSIDDEIFTFGPPLTGTLEFVRVDEPYRNYLNKMQEVHDLPLHPDKYERLYYKDEYLYKKVYKQKFEEIEKLLRRKVREQEDYEKVVQDILKQVAEEERQAEEARLRAIIEDEMRRIEIKRQEMIAQANKEHEEQVKRELERLEKEKRKQEEIERRKAEEAEAERQRQEEEARRILEEQEAELRRLEEQRVAREMEAAKQDLREQQTRILEAEKARIAEEERVAREIESAIEDLKMNQIRLLAEDDERIIEEEKERRIEKARIAEQVAAAKEDIKAQEIRMVEAYKEEQKALAEAKAQEEAEQKALEEAKAAEEAERLRQEEEAKALEEARVKEEEEQRGSKHRVSRVIRTKIVSINGKKVNAVLVEEKEEEVDDNQEPSNEEAPVKETLAPAKKQPKPVKQAPTKEAVSVNKENAFPHIKISEKGFVVQTSKGYYVDESTFVMRKKDAHVFKNKEEAVVVQTKVGGKVVKL